MIGRSTQRLSVKLSLLALHFRVWTGRYTSETVQFRRRRVHFGRLATAVALIDEIWARGEYDPPCKESPTVILDVGANIGVSVLWWNHLFPDARVIAVEPDPVSVALLRKNVAEWGLTYRTHVLESAVVGQAGEAILFSDAGSLGETTNSTLPPMAPSDSIRGIACAGVQLSHLIKSSRPQLVKIDIEGGEYEILLEALQANGPGIHEVSTLIVEFHHRSDASVGLESLVHDVCQRGYVARTTRGTPLTPEFFESLPATIWFLANGAMRPNK